VTHEGELGTEAATMAGTVHPSSSLRAIPHRCTGVRAGTGAVAL